VELKSDFINEHDLVELIDWCDDHNIIFEVDSYFYGKETSCIVKINLVDIKEITYACLKWGFTK